MTQDINVLVVDDSEFFAEMTASTLADDHGMETYWDASAEEALETFAETEIDCIVSDYDMPGTNGLELLSMVRERFGDVPFILLTGRGTEEVASKAISAGASDYILKLEVVEDQQYQQLATRIESAVEQRRAERRYELLVENTPDAVAQVSTDGEILAANLAMAELATKTQDRLVGSNIADMLPGDVGSEWLEHGREVIDEGESKTVEVTVRNRYLHNIFVPVDIRTERDTFQLIARDVTERCEREQELERQNDRLDKFASMVSHDLRNPLDVAEMNLSLLEEEFDEPPEYLENVRRSHERMGRLIDDLLTLARQGATVENPDPTDLETAIKQVWPYVETEDADLVVAVEGTVLADAGRFQEMLSNLVRNAVIHGESSTIRIGRLTDRDGIFVADDGVGIDPEDREAVFETGYSTADDGTGFGLSIVEEIVDAHGWEVSVTESRDGGARFEVTGMTFV